MTALHHSIIGEGAPLLVMHGLFGSSQNWQSLSRRFAAHRQVINLDLRNHGRSFHADEMNYRVMADDVAALIENLGLPKVDILGHSMGGKVAMTLALRAPELCKSLIIADIAPVAYQHHFDDLIHPIMTLSLETLQSREQANNELKLSIADQGLRAFLLHNLYREDGQWRWRVNWPVIQASVDQLVGFEDLPAGWKLEMPALFLRGEQSDYLDSSAIALIQRHFPKAQIAEIKNAGHWLHAEQPDAFSSRVIEFLQSA